MSRCLQLAKKGLGSTYPNPLVGSVVVHNDVIIGEGWHMKAGEAHAEVNAIQSVKNSGLLAEATLYVNLEPCSHFGKTPPCANFINSKGIKKVVIGTTDPNPMVSGKGIDVLRAAGCEVIVGILESECSALNKRFFTFHEKKRPYIFLKWAESADGYIAPKNRSKNGEPVWITNEDSRLWVHKMRSEEAAILVGTNTAIADNPGLTTRYWKGKSPLRVILDRNLRIDKQAAIFDGNVPTLVISEKVGDAVSQLVYEKIDFSKAVADQVMKLLFSQQIQSVIVEGGTKTIQTFIDEGLWDEAFVFRGDVQFKEGVKAPVINAEPSTQNNTTGDLMSHYKNCSH